MTYLDANGIIYLVEGTPELRERVASRIAPTEALCTSRLTRLECRVKPLRENNSQLLDAFDQVLGADNMTIVEIDSRVIDRAAEVRARLNFKTPDAIHIASAITAGADRFLTADQQLARCGELHVELI